MSNMDSNRLPIFRDDLSFQDRHERAFRDMQGRVDDDFGRTPSLGREWNKWNWEGDLDRLCGDFFQLKPRPGRVDDLKKDDFGSRESLDDNSAKNIYVENPQTKSRTFHLRFDVKEYSPNDITVKVENDTLLVEARHEDVVGGHKNVREFSRKVKIPADVQVDKLSSTLSNDGILTVQAPVPPKYTSVAYVNQSAPQQPQLKQNNSTGTQYQQRPQRVQSPRDPAPPAPPQYNYPPRESHVLPGLSQNITSETNASRTHAAAVPAPPMHAQQTRAPVPAPQTRAPEPRGASNHSSPLYQSSSQSAPAANNSSLTTGTPPPLFAQPTPPPMPLDSPIFRDSGNGGGREMELALEVTRPFTPEDVVVKLEGKSLKVEAIHEETTHGKTSRSSMSRSFDLEEDLDPGTVEAMLRSDGCLLIKGKVKPQS